MYPDEIELDFNRQGLILMIFVFLVIILLKISK
jgi:hypothetical protein